MPTELSKTDIEYVDKTAQTILGGMIAANDSAVNLSPEYFRGVSQSIYRAALLMLEVKKEYVAEIDIVEINLDEVDLTVEKITKVMEEVQPKIKKVAKSKTKPKTKAKKRGRPKKKSPTAKVEPLGQVESST